MRETVPRRREDKPGRDTPETHQELSKVGNEKTNSCFKRWATGLNRHLTGANGQMARDRGWGISPPRVPRAGCTRSPRLQPGAVAAGAAGAAEGPQERVQSGAATLQTRGGSDGTGRTRAPSAEALGPDRHGDPARRGCGRFGHSCQTWRGQRISGEGADTHTGVSRRWSGFQH